MHSQIIVFDLETTGKSVTKDRIISLSAQKLDLSFNAVEERKDLLINPLMLIPSEAITVHGITNEMVEMKPTFASYAKALHEYFKDCIIGGYNSIRFDVPLLSEEFARCNIQWPGNEPLIDSMKIFHRMEPRDLKSAVKFYTGDVFDDGHDAGRDVDATVKVLRGQMASYADLSSMGMRELELFCFDDKPRMDLAGKLIRNEAGQIVYNFGKDINKPVIDNPGFANWMLKNDFPTDTKNMIYAILNRKLK